MAARDCFITAMKQVPSPFGNTESNMQFTNARKARGAYFAHGMIFSLIISSSIKTGWGAIGSTWGMLGIALTFAYLFIGWIWIGNRTPKLVRAQLLGNRTSLPEPASASANGLGILIGLLIGLLF